MAKTSPLRIVAALAGAALAGCLLLLLGTSKPAQAAFPGENGKIAFERNTDGFFDIWVMDADGSNQTKLTDTRNSSNPAFSPNGAKIAYSSGGNIYVMNADGSNQTRVASNGGLTAWSPDGKKIAFSSHRNGNSDIYVMDANGSNQTRLTTDGAADSSPSFSPDGTKIAFERYKSGETGTSEIYVMDANGSNQTNLTNNSTSESAPNWSPDGAKIAFERVSPYDSGTYVMNSDGSNETFITAEGVRPAFSPDGKKITLTHRDSGSTYGEIYMVDSDGSNPTNLTNNSTRNDNPDWSVVASLPDTTKPTVSSVTPSNAATQVARNTNLTATFSEEMDPSTLTSSTVKLSNAFTLAPVPVGVSCDAPCKTVTIDPYPTDTSKLLAANKKYKATITIGAKDKAGNALDQKPSLRGNQAMSWTFTTGAN